MAGDYWRRRKSPRYLRCPGSSGLLPCSRGSCRTRRKRRGGTSSKSTSKSCSTAFWWEKMHILPSSFFSYRWRSTRIGSYIRRQIQTTMISWSSFKSSSFRRCGRLKTSWGAARWRAPQFIGKKASRLAKQVDLSSIRNCQNRQLQANATLPQSSDKIQETSPTSNNLFYTGALGL